jgi:transposase-like protein
MYRRCQIIMEHYTPEQRLHIVKTYFENGSSVTQTIRKLRAYFGRHHLPIPDPLI